MITFIILMVLIGIVCTIRIHRECKHLGVEFNPLGTGFLNWMGFYLGLGFGILGLFWVFINYLP